MNKTDSYKTQMTKSYVEDELMERIVEYADRNDMKQSPAVRKLIILGLRYEAMSKRSEAETQAEIVAYERRRVNINGVDEAQSHQTLAEQYRQYCDKKVPA